MPRGKSVFIIAGEASGDTHGAGLVRAMKNLDGSLLFSAVGGESLKKEGVEILVDSAELSVVGITEVLSKISAVFDGISTVKNVLKNRRPDLLILIDFPDFNLFIAKFAKKLGIPVLYYISPQIWAWRSGRIHTIKRNVDHMAVILPFEKEYYSAHSVPVTFVGHPLLDYYSQLPPKENICMDISKPVVGILPGSRHSEIERNLPVMLAAASQLRQRFNNIEFIVSLAPSIRREWVESYIHPYLNTCRIELTGGDIIGILEKSHLVVAASGTVTLETAIYGVPMVIVYRISPISYLFGRALVRVSHIGLVNIIANERIVPELIQEDATPAKIARTVGNMINSPQELQRICEKLKMVRQRLGKSGAAEKTAEIAMLLLNQYAPGRNE